MATPVADDREAYLQERLVARYGAEYGITPALVARIDAGTASRDELRSYTENVGKLAARFKSDMRDKPLEDYSSGDVELVMAMADANHRYAESADPGETLSKVVPTERVASLLGAPPGSAPPRMTGFTALSRHSEDLSPQQTIGQLGLDYKDTPFLVDDGQRDIAQPFLFTLSTPRSEEIRDSAKLPMDPRLLGKISDLAANATDPAQRERADRFLQKYQDEIVVIAKDTDDEAALRTRYPGYPIKKMQAGPYLGTSAPLYGDRLAGRNPYAAILQESYMDPPPAIEPGATLSVKLPRLGSGVDPERSDLPAGSDKLDVARWDGKRWQPLVSPDELDKKLARVMAPYRPRVSETWRSQLHDVLKSMPLKVPDALKRRVRDPKENRVLKQNVGTDRPRTLPPDRDKRRKRHKRHTSDADSASRSGS